MNTCGGEEYLIGADLIDQLDSLLGFEHLGVGVVEAAGKDQADVFFGDQLV